MRMGKASLVDADDNSDRIGIAKLLLLAVQRLGIIERVVDELHHNSAKRKHDQPTSKFITALNDEELITRPLRKDGPRGRIAVGDMVQ